MVVHTQFEESLQDTEVDAPMGNLHLHNLQVSLGCAQLLLCTARTEGTATTPRALQSSLPADPHAPSSCFRAAVPRAEGAPGRQLASSREAVGSRRSAAVLLRQAHPHQQQQPGQHAWRAAHLKLHGRTPRLGARHHGHGEQLLSRAAVLQCLQQRAHHAQEPKLQRLLGRGQRCRHCSRTNSSSSICASPR